MTSVQKKMHQLPSDKPIITQNTYKIFFFSVLVTARAFHEHPAHQRGSSGRRIKAPWGLTLVQQLRTSDQPSASKGHWPELSCNVQVVSSGGKHDMRRTMKPDMTKACGAL